MSWTAPTAVDNVGVVSFTSSHNPDDTFPVGTTTVTYTAADLADNQASASFDVTVVDAEPVITDYQVLNILADGTQDTSCTNSLTFSSGGQAVALIDADTATCTQDRPKEDKLKLAVSSTEEIDLITFYLNNGGYLVNTQVAGQAEGNEINFKSSSVSGTLKIKLVEVDLTNGFEISELDTQDYQVDKKKRIKITDLSSLVGTVSAGKIFGIQLTWKADDAKSSTIEIKWGKYDGAEKQTLINVSEGAPGSLPPPPTTEVDGFALSNDGDNFTVNPSAFTATSDNLFVSLTDTTDVDFTDLRKVEAELKDADKNKIKVILSDFVINGNTASATMTGLDSTFTDGEIVTFKIKAEDNDRNKVQFQIPVTINFP